MPISCTACCAGNYGCVDQIKKFFYMLRISGWKNIVKDKNSLVLRKTENSYFMWKKKGMFSSYPIRRNFLIPVVLLAFPLCGLWKHGVLLFFLSSIIPYPGILIEPEMMERVFREGIFNGELPMIRNVLASFCG